jgi:molybdopterin/thiamine biosynthesis adenylyltransferase
MLRFDRVEHLISPGALENKLVLQVGVGSGGATVNDHLTMNGVRRWTLFDPDTFDDLNLVKHPRQRKQLHRLKVEIQKEWILDRNPDADVEAFPDDVRASSKFVEAVRQADLVLCCVDTQEVRLYVNSIAVEQRKPCVTASVFRQGFGGEVYAYVPGTYGCFDCMGRVAADENWNLEASIAPTSEEEKAIYGLNLRDFKASGLSMDIQTIATIQARVALDILLTGSDLKFTPLPTNWIIFYNRPIPNNALSGFLKSVQLRVRSRKGCRCHET